MLVSRRRFRGEAGRLLPFAFLLLGCSISINTPLPFLCVSAHIHVAPEYFQRCDAVPSPPPSLTGGAWLLRELGNPRQMCEGSLGALFECGHFVDSPALPRHLQAADPGEPPLPEGEPQADAATGAGASSAAADRSKGGGAPLGPQAVLARNGPIEPRTKNLQHKGRSFPREADHKQHQKGRHQEQQKEQPFQEQQEEQQQDQQRRGGFSFSSFVSSIFSSASLVAATELGDRTFFLAALLALRYNRYLVFFATCAALFVASAVSAAAGHFLQNAAAYSWMPASVRSILQGGVVVQWISAIALFLFGVWHLYKAKACLSPHASHHRATSSRASIQLSMEADKGPPAEGALDVAAPHSGGASFNGGSDREGEPGGPKEGPSEGDSMSTRPSPVEWQGESAEIAENLGEAQEDLDRLQASLWGPRRCRDHWIGQRR